MKDGKTNYLNYLEFPRKKADTREKLTYVQTVKMN